MKRKRTELTDGNPDHLGRRVWCLPHVRTAILNDVCDCFVPKLLTLDKTTFPDVARRLYRSIDFRRYAQQSQSLWIPTERLLLYRDSVRRIDFNGGLPYCYKFPGGVPTLLDMFPHLHEIESGKVKWTRTVIDGEEHNEVVLTSEILRGSGNSARIARYKHGLPESWNVEQKYNLAVKRVDRFDESLQKATLRPIFLKDIKALHMDSHFVCCSECHSETAEMFPLERFLNIREENGCSAIPTISVSRSDPLPLDHFDVLADLVGPTVESLELAIDALCGGGRFQCSGDIIMDDDIPRPIDLLVNFDWQKFSALRQLDLELHFRAGDWRDLAGALNMYRVQSSQDDASAESTKPIIYSGPSLNLDRFNLSLIFHFLDSEEYPSRDVRRASMGWAVKYLPDPMHFAQSAIAIGGASCHTSVRWNESDDDDAEDYIPHMCIYNYLLEEAVAKGRETYSGPRGWSKMKSKD